MLRIQVSSQVSLPSSTVSTTHNARHTRPTIGPNPTQKQAKVQQRIPRSPPVQNLNGSLRDHHNPPILDPSSTSRLEKCCPNRLAWCCPYPPRCCSDLVASLNGKTSSARSMVTTAGISHGPLTHATTASTMRSPPSEEVHRTMHYLAEKMDHG